MPQVLDGGANVRPNRLAKQDLPIQRPRCAYQRLHRRTHAIGNRAEVPRYVGRPLLKLLERRDHGAALRVAHHHDEPRAEPCRSELDTADLRRSDDVSSHTNHEEIAESLIEHQFRGHTGIRAPEDDRKRRLACDQRRARLVGQSRPGRLIFYESPVALPEAS